MENTNQYISGYLLKRSGMMVWNKRYFELKSDPTPVSNLQKYFERTVETVRDPDDIKAYESVNKNLFENIATACVSGTGLLFYYEDEESTVPLDIVNLRSVLKLDKVKFGGKQHAFSIKSATRNLVLAAGTQVEKDEWLKAIIFFRRAIETNPDVTSTEEYQSVYAQLVNKQIFTTDKTTEEVDTVQMVPTDIIPDIPVKDDIPVIDGNVEHENSAEYVVAEEDVETEIEEQDETATKQRDIIPNTISTFSRGYFGLCMSCGATTAALKDDLQFNVDDEKLVLKGWLLKQGDYWKTWNERYFALNGTKLTYFRPGCADQAGSIDLDNRENTTTIESNPENLSLTIISNGVTGNSLMKLKAESEIEWKKWIDAMENILQ